MASDQLLHHGITLPAMAHRTKDRTPFGERLFEARSFAKLSQKDLADAVDLSQNNISHLEIHGQGSPKVAEMALACGVRVAWLSRGDGEMLEADTSGALHVAEALAAYGPIGGADYQTVVHSLADALEEAGTEVSVKQFVKMADQMHRKFSRRQ